MFTFKFIRKLYLLFLFSYVSENSSYIPGGSGKEVSKDLSIEQKKFFIEKTLLNKDIVSLDDNPKLVEDILNGIKNNTLDEDQINTIYNEITKIKKVEEKILTPENINRIETEAAKDKFDKIRLKIKKIKKMADLEQKKDIEEAERMICAVLDLCD